MLSSNYSFLPDKLTGPLLKVFAKKKLKKVLVACSGGPDSKALFAILESLSLKLGLELGVVHIDHRWRQGSEVEALELKDFVEQKGCAFHLKTLDSAVAQTETAARQMRLQIFAELLSQYGYEAVVLGHQKEDQAETVLKRIFEGASLQALAGIQERMVYRGILLLRPWLNVPKQIILDFCEEKKLNYVIDVTNLDQRYLRGRMRSDLFPFLEQSFGKSIVSSLTKLGQEACELAFYMEGRYGSLLQELNFLDLRTIATPFEMRWLISEWFKRHNLLPSSKIIDQIISLVIQGKADKQVELQGERIYIDRKQLFLVSQEKKSLPTSRKLEMGQFNFGDWEVSVRQVDSFQEKRGWRNGWQGELMATLPVDQYWIGSFNDFKDRQDQLRISKRWSNQKIPAFLKKFIPLIFTNEQICYDFLDSTASVEERDWKSPWIQVFLRNTLSWNDSIDKIK